jgi:hypothetical protein
MHEVCLGSETDTALLAALKSVVLMSGGSMAETTFGVGGSQELITYSIAVPGGQIEAVSETYIGLSLRGPTAIVEEIAQAVRALNRQA